MAKYADTEVRGSRYGCCGARVVSVGGLVPEIKGYVRGGEDEGEGGEDGLAWCEFADGVVLRVGV